MQCPQHGTEQGWPGRLWTGRETGLWPSCQVGAGCTSWSSRCLPRQCDTVGNCCLSLTDLSEQNIMIMTPRHKEGGTLLNPKTQFPLCAWFTLRLSYTRQGLVFKGLGLKHFGKLRVTRAEVLVLAQVLGWFQGWSKFKWGFFVRVETERLNIWAKIRLGGLNDFLKPHDTCTTSFSN